MVLEKISTLESEHDKWVDIPDFEGLYRINPFGDIRSLPRNGTKGGIIKPSIDRYGYLKVVLHKNNKSHYYTVHRLVAKTFVDNPLNKDTVNHIDGNKTNNYYKNLEWVSMKENLEHSYRCGLQRHPNEPIKAINLNTGETYFFNSHKEAGRKLGIRQSTISRALKRDGLTKGYKFLKQEVK